MDDSVSPAELQIVGSTRPVETNPISVFVYQSDYPWRERGLCLKFNESWMVEAARFYEGNRKRVRLNELPDNSQGIAKSWKFATEVPGLRVRLPDSPITVGKPINEPIQIIGDVTCVILPDYRYAKYAAAKDGLYILVVDSDGLKSYETGRRGWVESEFQMRLKQ